MEDGRRRSTGGDDPAGQTVHHPADDGHPLQAAHSGGVLRSGERRLELPRLAGRMGRLLRDRSGHGQHAGQDGHGRGRQSVADDLSFGALSGGRGPGHGPGHVRPRGHAAESPYAGHPRSADRRTRRGRTGQRPERQGPHGRTAADRRIRREAARRNGRKKKDARR